MGTSSRSARAGWTSGRVRSELDRNGSGGGNARGGAEDGSSRSPASRRRSPGSRSASRSRTAARRPSTCPTTGKSVLGDDRLRRRRASRSTPSVDQARPRSVSWRPEYTIANPLGVTATRGRSSPPSSHFADALSTGWSRFVQVFPSGRGRHADGLRPADAHGVVAGVVHGPAIGGGHHARPREAAGIPRAGRAGGQHRLRIHRPRAVRPRCGGPPDGPRLDRVHALQDQDPGAVGA